MAMTFNFNINPFGYNADPIQFGGMKINATHHGTHAYEIYFEGPNGREYVYGEVPRTKSGYRLSR